MNGTVDSASAKAPVDRLTGVAEFFARIRRTLRLGERRAAGDAVRLPTVMTFVVVMFAATVALVWFGYVATREWRSGTNLLLERRANEALARDHGEAALIDPEEAPAAPIPLHAGAARYYREREILR